jgi:type I restriction enzyme, S subunit
MEQWQLPNNWEWISLGDERIAEVIMGQSPPGYTYNSSGVGLPFYQGKADFGDLYPSPHQWCSAPKKIAEPDDILISVRAPVGPTNLCKEKSAIGRGLSIIRSRNTETKYLLFALRNLEPQISKMGQGSTFPAINKQELINIGIPIPYPDEPIRSLEIQKRIVTRLEALLAEVAEARGLQEKTADDVDKLFNAFSRQVFEDIESKYACQVLEPLTTKIGSGSTPRGGKSIYLSSGIPLIRSLNVRWNEFTIKELAYIDDEIHQHMRNTIVQPGDVFLNITGASIGRSCCVPDEICPANVNQHVMIIRPIKDQMRSRFLMYWLTSPNTQDFILKTQSGATRQALTKEQVQNLNVPLPPTDIQDYFVNYLDNVVSEVREMRSTLDEQEKTLTQLEQSFLAQAFRGEL